MSDNCPEKLTKDQLLGYFERFKNWGRWGDDDQLGTLNLITDEKRKKSASGVQHGRAVGCARMLSPKAGKDNPHPVLHHMIEAGGDAPDEGMHQGADWFGLAIHGYAFTHVDALNHIFWNREMYNGRPASMLSTPIGSKQGSIEWLKDGIVSRGVLIDVPHHRGVDALEAGEAVHVDEVLSMCASIGVTLETGDILLVRTGRDAHGTIEGSAGAHAGLHACVLPLIHDVGLAALGSDAANDVLPSGFDGIEVPIHAVGVSSMGLLLLDNAYFEDLAEACRELSRWEFLFTMAPLRLKNSTGSPLTPIAVL